MRIDLVILEVNQQFKLFIGKKCVGESDSLEGIASIQRKIESAYRHAEIVQAYSR